VSRELLEGPVTFLLPTGGDGGLSDDLVHTFCDCEPDIALCGVEVWGDEMKAGPEDTLCTVCEHLKPGLCERCGR
jgi:hypothetical protein